MSRAWMPLYCADYLADTGHLSTVEHGAYMLLIMHYWQHGGIPTPDLKLARICRLTVQEWQEIKETLSDLFDAGWTHKRIDAELAKAEQVISKRKAAGIAGASARYGKGMANANGLPKQTHRQSQSQSQSHDDAIASSDASEKYDLLERQLRQAAGQEGNPAIGLEDLSPIFALTDSGYSLDSDILPVARTLTGKSLQSWRYLAKAVESRKGEKPMPPAQSSKIVDAVEWVTADDYRWPSLAERYRNENGGRDPPQRGGQGGMGYHFRRAWVDATIPPQLQRTG